MSPPAQRAIERDVNGTLTDQVIGHESLHREASPSAGTEKEVGAAVLK